MINTIVALQLAIIVKETNNENLYRSYNSILFSGEKKNHVDFSSCGKTILENRISSIRNPTIT
jgi:hypothetical protein